MMREMRSIHEFNIKEEKYIDKLSSQSTPLPQMFTEYFNFKMEMHRMRTEKELENQYYGEDPKTCIKFRHDAGTPIFITSLTDRIVNNLVDKIGQFTLTSDNAQLEYLAYHMAHSDEL